VNRLLAVIGGLYGALSVSPAAPVDSDPCPRAVHPPPRVEDEEPEFLQTRGALLAAIATGDRKAIEHHLADRITYGDETVSRSEFVLRIERDDGWANFVDGLRAGLEAGAVRMVDGSLGVPYTVGDHGDVGACGIVTGRNIRARELPRLGSKVIARLTYEIVPLASPDVQPVTTEDGQSCRGWQPVRLRDQGLAWVCGRYLWMHGGTGYFFRREHRRWLLRQVGEVE
jgi:hypothetical protein